ncbi:MAG: ArsR family transcriptional regulator [Candidatus Dadabacteria bacterium]|nr:MAG: ArsR family transcriptional regulator [Candidatus Dadabacteria bacterium]
MSRPNRRRHDLSPEALELVAVRFRLLGEPTRLMLLTALEEGEKTVGELAEMLGCTQANVSRHLRALTDAGILGRRKEGLFVYYYIADPSIFALCDLVCGSLQKRLNNQVKALG